MAGGILPASVLGKPPKQYEGHITMYLVFTCLVASSASFIMGYELGISGGVTSMDDFLQKFFPNVFRNVREHRIRSNNYCRYSSQTLQLFTSSLYLAGSLATLPASYVTRYHGRKLSILIGGISFLAGGILNGAAQNLGMLITGRICWGFGLGFSYQAMPMYIAEMSPANLRGFFFTISQSGVTLGVLAASLINYATGPVTPNGWRISLGLATVPAVIQTLGGIFLPDTPNSLVERGYEAEGRRVLEEIRGVEIVDAEFADILEAAIASREVKSQWGNLLNRRYAPQLLTGLSITIFQELGGNTAVTFYSPVLFKTLGFGSNSALYSAVILGSVKVVCGWLSTLVVDRAGRKVVLYEGGIAMAVCQFSIGIIFGLKLGLHNSLDHTMGVLVLILLCVFAAGFTWSWGPVGWLIPSEIYPLEIRSTALSLTVAVNFLSNFVIAQVFLTMLCHLKMGTFFFFGGWLLFMTLFVALLVPETKKVPIETMASIWREHWFWKRFVTALADGEQGWKEDPGKDSK